MTTRLEFVPVDLIDPHPSNPRRDLGDLTELADSIRAQGIRQPLLLVPRACAECAARGLSPCTHDIGDRYMAVIGHRRLAASKLAELEDVPCTIDPSLSQAQQVELMLLENIQRTDLSPIEEANGYQELLDLGVKVPEIAKTTGRSKATITGRLRLLKLPDAAREKVHTRQATLEDAAKIDEFSGDPETIERLVAALGTPNFGWQVDRARSDVKVATKMTAMATKLAKKGLTQLGDEPEKTDYVTVQSSYGTAIPKDLKDATHFHVARYGYLYLYRATTQAERDKWDKSAAAKARKQARDEAAAIEQQLVVEECETAERLRTEFTRGRLAMSRMTAYDRQQITTVATRMLVLGQLEIRGWDVGDLLEEFLGRKVAVAEWLDAYTGTPEALLLLLMHSKQTLGKWQKPHWKHAASNPGIVALYRLLDELGYPLSDAERARVFPDGRPCSACGHPDLDHDVDDGRCTITSDDPNVEWAECPCTGLELAS